MDKVIDLILAISGLVGAVGGLIGAIKGTKAQTTADSNTQRINAVADRLNVHGETLTQVAAAAIPAVAQAAVQKSNQPLNTILANLAGNLAKIADQRHKKP